MIDAFLQQLEIPPACFLNKPVFKKMFLENAALDGADKKCLREDILKIQWLYTFKPSTINIQPFQDTQRDYSEVAVLQVELADTDKANKKVSRIASFMQRAIPYPLVLLFSKGNVVCLSVAEKRINQADKEKWVVENFAHTRWVNLLAPCEEERAFLDDMKISRFSFADFQAFYESWRERIIALRCADHTGHYELNHVLHNAKNEGGNCRLALLTEMEKLGLRKTELANKLKNETQLAKQIELNTQIKHIKDRINELKEAMKP